MKLPVNPASALGSLQANLTLFPGTTVLLGSVQQSRYRNTYPKQVGKLKGSFLPFWGMSLAGVQDRQCPVGVGNELWEAQTVVFDSVVREFASRGFHQGRTVNLGFKSYSWYFSCFQTSSADIWVLERKASIRHEENIQTEGENIIQLHLPMLTSHAGTIQHRWQHLPLLSQF